MKRRDFLKYLSGLSLALPLGNVLASSIARPENPRYLAKALTWPGESLTGEVQFSSHRRIKLPDSLGPEWSGKLIITPSLPPNGVWIFTELLWEPMLEKIMALDSYNRQQGLIQRLIVGYAEDVMPKADGTYAIPKSITTIVKLPRKLVLVIKEKGLALHPVAID